MYWVSRPGDGSPDTFRYLRVSEQGAFQGLESSEGEHDQMPGWRLIGVSQGASSTRLGHE